MFLMENPTQLNTVTQTINSTRLEPSIKTNFAGERNVDLCWRIQPFSVDDVR